MPENREEKSTEKRLFQRYSEDVEAMLDDKDAKEIFDALSSGQSTYLRTDRISSSIFDMTWMNEIEACIGDLSQIVNNPKMITKDIGEIVPVELAKKVTAVSVMHLASHSNLIKDIDEDGNVIPNKILSMSHDDEVKTYENRFIATLIRQLVLFIEKRYLYIMSFADVHDEQELYFKNHSVIRGAYVNIETHVKVVGPGGANTQYDTQEYIKRVQKMREFILYFYNSPFMKHFKADHDVRTPIMQTNIIRKNPKYHHCYELFMFLRSYDQLGITFAVNNRYSKFSTEEIHDMNCLMLANYISLQGKEIPPAEIKEKKRKYAPVILKTSDDEIFTYGSLLKGPIKFVRADAPYLNYLYHQAKLKEDVLPVHPTREERAYFVDDYNTRAICQSELYHTLRLLERKGKEEIEFAPEIKHRIEQRLLEDERVRMHEVQRRLDATSEYLRRFRQKVVDDARKFRPNEIDDPTKDYSSLYLTNQEKEERERAQIAYTLQEERVDLLPKRMMTDSEIAKQEEEYRKLHPEVIESHTDEIIGMMANGLALKVQPLETMMAVEILDSQEEEIPSETLHGLIGGLEVKNSKYYDDEYPTPRGSRVSKPLFDEPIASQAGRDDTLPEIDTTKPLPPRPIVVFAPLSQRAEKPIEKPAEPAPKSPSTKTPVIVFSDDNMPMVDDSNHIAFTSESVSYLVMTDKGYYAGVDMFTSNKRLARVFSTMSQANAVATSLEGKVIRL